MFFRLRSTLVCMPSEIDDLDFFCHQCHLGDFIVKDSFSSIFSFFFHLTLRLTITVDWFDQMSVIVSPWMRMKMVSFLLWQVFGEFWHNVTSVSFLKIVDRDCQRSDGRIQFCLDNHEYIGCFIFENNGFFFKSRRCDETIFSLPTRYELSQQRNESKGGTNHQ